MVITRIFSCNQNIFFLIKIVKHTFGCKAILFIIILGTNVPPLFYLMFYFMSIFLFKIILCFPVSFSQKPEVRSWLHFPTLQNPAAPSFLHLSILNLKSSSCYSVEFPFSLCYHFYHKYFSSPLSQPHNLFSLRISYAYQKYKRR